MFSKLQINSLKSLNLNQRSKDVNSKTIFLTPSGINKLLSVRIPPFLNEFINPFVRYLLTSQPFYHNTYAHTHTTHTNELVRRILVGIITTST